MSEKIRQQMIDHLVLQPVRLPETDRTTIPMGGHPIMGPVPQASANAPDAALK